MITRKAATPRAAAGIIVVRGDAVLLVRPTYKEEWDVPGGVVEVNESPRAACVREVREELGLEIGRLDLASVDWAPNPHDGDKLLFLFTAPELTADTLAGAIFADGEIAETRFVALTELDHYTVDRLARRLRATAAAIADHRTPVYLEHGRPVGLPGTP